MGLSIQIRIAVFVVPDSFIAAGKEGYFVPIIRSSKQQLAFGFTSEEGHRKDSRPSRKQNVSLMVSAMK
ncbi:hypothetical protein [Desulforhopalus singaporensis]|uniref:hypothetical protein n=1 Tax=Desulforhopalus singaporensis TaxID=91360 RepID=UPI0015A1A542|nr:hypothetical protein [Desulforhopalus singaporensis]